MYDIKTVLNSRKFHVYKVVRYFLELVAGGGFEPPTFGL